MTRAKEMVVYKTINNINGKAYIGKDGKNNPKYLGSGKALNQAIKKYGRKNFTKIILTKCKTPGQLNVMERLCIALLKTKSPNGYNLTDGGDGFIGLTPEARERIRLGSIGTKRSKEAKEKNRLAHLGKRASLETRQKQSKALKERYKIIPHHMNGKTIPEEIRAKMSASNKGKNSGGKNGMFGKSVRKGTHHSDEAKQKNRDKHLALWQTEEYRNKISNSTKSETFKRLWADPLWRAKMMKAQEDSGAHEKATMALRGKHLSEDHKNKISDSNKGRVVSLETRNKISNSNKGREISMETRRKISKAFKGKVYTNEERIRLYASRRGPRTKRVGGAI
jgi:hypothetical protein